LRISVWRDQEVGRKEQGGREMDGVGGRRKGIQKRAFWFLILIYNQTGGSLNFPSFFFQNE